MMDVVLEIRGPRGGQWKSLSSWTHTEETLYNEWKRTVDTACTANWDIDGFKYDLLRWKAVEEAIWAEELRLQDDASDAKWLDKLLRRTTASYELRCRDYVTWFANYKRRKATEQYQLDREHRLRCAKAEANIAQKLAAALTIFLWNRRLRMCWWFKDQTAQR